MFVEIYTSLKALICSASLPTLSQKREGTSVAFIFDYQIEKLNKDTYTVCIFCKHLDAQMGCICDILYSLSHTGGFRPVIHHTPTREQCVT